MRFNTDDLEKICKEQSDCKNCPLLITRVVVPDETYDYHTINICYLKNYDKIKKIESFILDGFEKDRGDE